MTPKNVVVLEQDGLTTWTLFGESVSFHPSEDPNMRRRQEHDLLIALVERIDIGAPAKAPRKKARA